MTEDQIKMFNKFIEVGHCNFLQCRSCYLESIGWCRENYSNVSHGSFSAIRREIDKRRLSVIKGLLQSQKRDEKLKQLFGNDDDLC